MHATALPLKRSLSLPPLLPSLLLMPLLRVAPQPHRAPVADMAVDASGGFVATGSSDRSVKVTDLAGGFVTHHFTGHR